MAPRTQYIRIDTQDGHAGAYATKRGGYMLHAKNKHGHAAGISLTAAELLSLASKLAALAAGDPAVQGAQATPPS